MPGAAHAATFWGFIVLLLTIIEAYGDLFDKRFAIRTTEESRVLHRVRLQHHGLPVAGQPDLRHG